MTGRDLTHTTDFANVSCFQHGPLVIDLEVHSPESIAACIERLSRRYDEAMKGDRRRSLELSPRELDFLHRLATGIPLFDPEAFDSLRGRVDLAKLRVIALLHSVIIGGAEQEDLSGFVAAGDLVSARFAAQRHIGFAIDGVLAALGTPVVKEKWRVELLRRFAVDGWDADLPGGPLPQPLVDTYTELAFEQSREPGDARQAIRRSVQLANRLVPWTQRRLEFGFAPSPGHLRQAGAQGDVEFPVGDPVEWEHRPWPLSPHVRVEYRQDRFEVTDYRSRRTVRINEVAYEALCRFDGTTPLRRTVAWLSSFSPTPQSVLVASVRDLEEYLRSIGFLDVQL